jgi:nitrogen fixation-related uncharacterized protein
MFVAFGVCAVFFIVAIAGIMWAFKNGEFEDMEGSKFEMMDDELDGVAARKARAAVERARLKSSANS